MECQQARQLLVASLSGELGDHDLAVLREHCEACEGCRAELGALRQTWARLGDWPDNEPALEIGTRLVRRVRWLALRESLLTVRGWTPAVLAGVIGGSVSLGLSLLVPYSLLVSVCQRVFPLAEPTLAPYVMAGTIYGLPLALGAVVALRRPAVWGFLRSLEAAVVFFLILAPYAIAQCREFPPALQVAFLSGMAVGALLGSLSGVWLGRRFPFAQPQT